jgi:ABC-2 type transport system permease protein
LSLIWPELLALTGIGLVFFAVTLARFRKSLAA